MIADDNYGAPFDYYMTNIMERDMSFRYYWTSVSYFNQASAIGADSSTIQSDQT
jgi:hypothetical protein